MSRALFILVCIFFGTGFVLMKWSVGVFGPAGVGAWRATVAAGTLGILWLLFRRGRPWPFGRRDVGALVMLGAFGFALPWAVQSYVIQRVGEFDVHSSTFVGMMLAFLPPFVVIARVPLLGVYPTKREITGVLGGMVLMGLLFRAELGHGVPLVVAALAAIPPICFAFAHTYTKRRFSDAPAIALRMTLMVIAGAILLPISRPDQIVIDENFLPAASWLFLLGAVTTGIGGAILVRLIQTRGPLYAGMVTYIIPAIAIMVGWSDGEEIDPSQIIIMLGVFVMVALVQTGSAKVEVEPSAQAEAED